MYKHEKACYRHSHRVPVAGYMVRCNRLKLCGLHYPPPIAYSKCSEAIEKASVQSVYVRVVWSMIWSL